MQVETTNPSPLLQLAAELRNEIWTVVIQEDEIVTIPVSGQHARPPLLQVCKQITAEASPVYYSLNTFRAIITNKKHRGPINWLHRIGLTNANAITSLAFQLDMHEDDAKLGKWILKHPLGFVERHNPPVLSKVSVRHLLRAGLRIDSVSIVNSGLLWESDGQALRRARLLMPNPFGWKQALWLAFERMREQEEASR